MPPAAVMGSVTARKTPSIALPTIASFAVTAFVIRLTAPVLFKVENTAIVSRQAVVKPMEPLAVLIPNAVAINVLIASVVIVPVPTHARHAILPGTKVLAQICPKEHRTQRVLPIRSVMDMEIAPVPILEYPAP